MNNSIANNLLGKKSEVPTTEFAEKRKDAWHAYRNRAATARMIRRARRAEMVRLTRKYHENVARSEQDFNRITEAEAVRRVREWEKVNGIRAYNSPAVRVKLALAGFSDKPVTSLDTIEVADLLGLLDETDEAAK